MDEAFLPFSEMIRRMSDIPGSIGDESIRMEIEKIFIETPVEIFITENAKGVVEIGSVPPLYAVETSFQNSYHTIRFTLEK